MSIDSYGFEKLIIRILSNIIHIVLDGRSETVRLVVELIVTIIDFDTLFLSLFNIRK